MKIITCLLAITALSSWVNAKKPNVIVIMADDLGYGDLGCYGAKPKNLKTPNIDKLAKEGIKFTSGYCSASTCTPTRYSFLTGTYAFRGKNTGIAPPSSPLIKDIQKELNAQNVPAYTLIVDPRDANRVIGMRYLDIPQFYAAEDFARMSPENYGAHVRQTFGAYDELGRNLKSKFPSIKASEPALFDVNVKPRRQTEDYVAQLSMEGADADALNTEFFGYRPATDRFREYVGDDKAYDTRVRGGPGGTKGERGSITPGGLLGAGAVGAASTPTFQDKAVAFGETLLDAGQAMIAPIAAAPHALIPALTSDRPTAQIEQGYQNLLQQMDYEPSTQLGQEYSQAAQQFMGDAFNAAAQSAPGQAIKQVVEPINLLIQQAPERARLVGRSLLDMSPF